MISAIASTVGAVLSPVVGAMTLTKTLWLTVALPSVTLTVAVNWLSWVTLGAVIANVLVALPDTVNSGDAVQLNVSGSLSASVAEALTETLSPAFTVTVLDTDNTGFLLLGGVTTPPKPSCIALRISPLSASISHANNPPKLY